LVSFLIYTAKNIPTNFHMQMVIDLFTGCDVVLLLS